MKALHLFLQDFGGVTLRYATAELMCRIAKPDVLVFFAWPGVRPEFSFQAAAGDRIEAAAAHVSHEDSRTVVTGIDPGTNPAIRVTHPGRDPVQILVLSRPQALNLWKARLAGRDRLLLSPAGLRVPDPKAQKPPRASDSSRPPARRPDRYSW